MFLLGKDKSFHYLLLVAPVFGIVAVVGRKANDITFSSDTKSYDHSVHIVKITRYLIDLENFSVGKTNRS